MLQPGCFLFNFGVLASLALGSFTLLSQYLNHYKMLRTISAEAAPAAAKRQQKHLIGKTLCVDDRAGPSLRSRQPKLLPQRSYSFDWKYYWGPGGRERYFC